MPQQTSLIRNESQSDTSIVFKWRTERSKLRAEYSLMGAHLQMKSEGFLILRKIDELDKRIDAMTRKTKPGNSHPPQTALFLQICFTGKLFK